MPCLATSREAFFGTDFTDREECARVFRRCHVDNVGELQSNPATDVIGDARGSTSLYQYSYNSPVVFVDPEGTAPRLGSPAWAVIAPIAIGAYTGWGALTNATYQNGVLTIPPTSQWKSSFPFTPAIPIPIGLQWNLNQPLWKIPFPRILKPTQMCPGNGKAT